MLMRVQFISVVVLVCANLAVAAPDDLIRVARQPSVSPNGKRVAFAYRGDIWTVATKGGKATRLTLHDADDADPMFSPDGKKIAFVSMRAGSRQAFVVDTTGGKPKQVTFHTEGCYISDWYSDGNSLLVFGKRDHYWRFAERFLKVNLQQRSAEQKLFDAHGHSGSLSHDGKKLLFVREGERWWRKGYHGPRAGQIWMYDITAGAYTKMLSENTGCRWPIWKPDGSGFYYVSAKSGSFNLWDYTLKSKQTKQLTKFDDDPVVYPSLSRDGSTIVFRHLFDLYRFNPANGKRPKQIRMFDRNDVTEQAADRRTLDKATEIAPSKDGLDIAFIAGGDVWVMDTVVREPRQVTATAEFESDVVFAPDGKSIVFVASHLGQPDIWRAERADEKKHWWQNDSFKLTQVTKDADAEFNLRFTPDGKSIAFTKTRGDLWIMNADGSGARRILAGPSSPRYSFSPDGKWIVYSRSDVNFNSDVWLMPVDGSKKPYNLSRHPRNDYSPVWSPDGRVIAFTGYRDDEEVDIHYVWTAASDNDTSSRQRKLKSAIEKINKVRKAKPKSKPEPAGKKTEEKPKAETKPKPKPVVTKIDLDGIHKRVHRIKIPNSAESGLFWSSDGKKLAFNAAIDGKKGTYTVEFPDKLKPKLLSTVVGKSPTWLKQGNQIVWLANGVPGSLSATGAAAGWTFKSYQTVDQKATYKAAFDESWRKMRDWFYDGKFKGKNWDAIRRKYQGAAASVPDMDGFLSVVHMMLGELNASHLGFYPKRSVTKSTKWVETTAHLGLRFDESFKGPGLKVRDVLSKGPATKSGSLIKIGEVVVSIDGVAVDPAMDMTTILNGRMDRDIRLKVRNAKKEDRDVTLRPIAYAAARLLLYQDWIEDNRAAVDRMSKGKLGYLHVRSMNGASFHQFQRDLYAVGFGKEGLVIDVRENGGGYTTDHLLTALTQPRHATTVGRGGGPGYPQDRTVYATWHKPVVVLCNQNSFSNAEIFSHAIKNLKRGKLVGVQTAGGVISTGSAPIMDVGMIRVPFRGWYVNKSGKDMELNGAVPDIVVWPKPGQMPKGKDVQLEKAIQVLMKEMR